MQVASSREDAWIETILCFLLLKSKLVASSREDAWIETLQLLLYTSSEGRVLPRGRVD